MDLDPATDLTFTRTLPVPPERVWRCWTTPALLRRFFVPAPHAVTACTIELRVGGRFETTFDIGGTAIENKGVWLELVPNRRLVFTDAYTDDWKPAPEPFLTGIVDMQEDGAGGTVYTVTARHRTQAAREAHEAMGFYQGWGTATNQLAELARTLPPA